MGSGRSNTELTYSAKTAREKKRREKVQRKRLVALGVPENEIRKLNSKEVRQMLISPQKTKKRWAGKA